MNIPIPRYIQDPFYRYKMPDLKIKHRNHRTQIFNLDHVAQSLRVPTDYILFYIGFELKCRVRVKDNLLSSHFSLETLQDCLDKFIEKYILCPHCQLPEMVLKIKETELIGDCNACGAKNLNLNDTHKFVSYVKKNPPKNMSDLHHIKDPLHDLLVHTKYASDSDSDEEEQKTEEVATNTNQKKKSSLVFPIEDFQKDEEKLILQIQKLYQEILRDSKDLTEGSQESVFLTKAKEILPSMNENQVSWVIFNGIFDINIAKNIEKNKNLLQEIYKAFEINSPEIDLLLNLEKFLLVKYSSAGFEKYIPTILQMFWNEELLSEETLHDWNEGKLDSRFIMDFRFEKSIDKQFKTAAKSFLDWLEKEEEED